ncbi:hypothetical protein ZIOFF_047490 [Zingiber officinale]|uniref:BED-type domain-containing protein n=1 Tax=Zingiber officinale TaxID=94328 RepID=A0A8J5KQ49_ZINOF|nr:hypothetical protein ZIOFF_047490 [Zingiber officinale]
MESFQNESAHEDVDDYSPLWKFVTKVEKTVGGGNVTWSCNICNKVCKGSYSRVKAHLLKQKGAGIAELRKKNSKQKEVPLSSSSASSNMASKSSFCTSGILQNDDPTKKRKGPLGPLEKSFNLNVRDELHSEIARLFYTGGLSFNIARNPPYVRAFSLATQRTIPGYLPPGYNLLRTSLLQKEKAHIGKLLEPTKAAWKQKGNVVQVVTNNAPVCKAAGLLVEAKYPHIFWTPCVVHTLNLALKNICALTDSLQNKEAFDKCKWIVEVANDASMIKNFIMNHNIRLSMFNDNSNLKMLSLADTRFASTIIMLKRDIEVSRERKKCIERYYSNSSERRSVNEEFASFSAAIDDFSDNDSMRDRGLMSPTKWWVIHGASTPTLQSLALKLLGHPSSSSSCERNWSTYNFIHSLKRNKMTPQRAEDLVYVHYNLCLLSRRSPHYNEGESKMWDVGADGFDSMDMEGAAILEIANLSLDEPELESVLFTDEGGVGDETDMDV